MERALNYSNGAQNGASVLTGHTSNIVRVILNSNSSRVLLLFFFLMRAATASNTLIKYLLQLSR